MGTRYVPLVFQQRGSQPEGESGDPHRTRQRQANRQDQQQDEEGNTPGEGQELDRRLKTAPPPPRRDRSTDIYETVRNCSHAGAPELFDDGSHAP